MLAASPLSNFPNSVSEGSFTLPLGRADLADASWLLERESLIGTAVAEENSSRMR